MKNRVTHVTIRITPACAGTTFCFSSRTSALRDHPRLRGNNLSVEGIVTVVPGSPPLAREQLICDSDYFSHFGITPACAGTTCINGLGFRYQWDHPRLRGNNP